MGVDYFSADLGEHRSHWYGFAGSTHNLYFDGWDAKTVWMTHFETIDDSS